MSGRDTPARTAARTRLATHRLRGHRPPRRLDAPVWYRAIIAYDGADFAGWQRQPDVVGIAEMMDAALELATGGPVVATAAGRTDAGVHADGQAISFQTDAALPPDALRHLCLQLLPPTIRVVHVEAAPDGFRVQRDVTSKLYRYCILESPQPSPVRERAAWRFDAPLDLDAVRAAAAHLVGTHDFRAFRNDPGPARRDEDTVRTITSLDVDRAWDRVRFDVGGPGFLYMMVRNLTAALVEVGTGRQTPAWVAEILAQRDRRHVPAPAPPEGLRLVSVEYPDGFGAARAPLF